MFGTMYSTAVLSVYKGGSGGSRKFCREGGGGGAEHLLAALAVAGHL